MPDYTADIPHDLLEGLLEPRADKPPVGTQMGPHDFIESEFEQGAGRCDVCGGGPDAKIHHHVDPMERIAVALEAIVTKLDGIENGVAELAIIRCAIDQELDRQRDERMGR